MYYAQLWVFFKSGVSVTFHVHLLHPDGFALHGRSRDFSRFAIFLFYTGDSPAGSYVVAPRPCFNLSQAEA